MPDDRSLTPDHFMNLVKPALVATGWLFSEPLPPGEALTAHLIVHPSFPPPIQEVFLIGWPKYDERVTTASMARTAVSFRIKSESIVASLCIYVGGGAAKWEFALSVSVGSQSRPLVRGPLNQLGQRLLETIRGAEGESVDQQQSQGISDDVLSVIEQLLGRYGWRKARQWNVLDGMVVIGLSHERRSSIYPVLYLVLTGGVGNVRQLDFSHLNRQEIFAGTPLCAIVLPFPQATLGMANLEVDLGLNLNGEVTWSRERLGRVGDRFLDLLGEEEDEKGEHQARGAEEEEGVPTNPSVRRIVADDLLATSDGVSTAPGLGFDRIAAAIVKLVNGVVAEAQDRDARDESLITVGVYGLWGSGKSTLMRAIRSTLPPERYLSISVNPWRIAEKETLCGYFRDRTLDQLAPFFPGIRSRTATRLFLWLSNLPWLWGSLLIAAIFVGAILLDSTARWKMVQEIIDAWWSAEPGKWIADVVDAMGRHGVSPTVGAVPILAAVLWLIVKLAPMLWEGIKTKFQLIATSDASENLQSLYRDLAKFAKSENRTLAFFVDDLDRCTPARVAEFVESIHSLTAAGCVVFVACDDEYVSAALNAKYKEIVAQHRDGKGFGRGFLAKIVQVPFRVPMVDEAGARSVVFPSRHAPVAGGTAPVAAKDSSPMQATGLAAPPPPEINLEEAQLSAILDETVGVFVHPLGLNIRFLKSLVGTIKLQLDIGGFASEAEARRLAAAAFADAVDPAWLDAHALRHEAPQDSVLALHSDLVDRLQQAIGLDEAELRRIYQRLGRRPRPVARVPPPPAT